ncbi:MAG: hypothetical protein P2A85_03385 [Microcoleus anatoxicus]|uniref:glycine-rich domain-containing protein n=1 Tax=Microcoleus anatoxicus TaxID=2705319 RepID=UPI00366B3A26
MTSTLVKSDSEQMESIHIRSKNILGRVMSYDLSVIRERFLKDNPELSSRLDSIELVYRQYMYLCAIKPRMSLSVPSNEVDEFWHCHIIHTREYQDFCNEIAGYFIHHAPHSALATNKEKKVARRNFLSLFMIHFQDSTNVESLKCGLNFSVDLFGDCQDCHNCVTCRGGEKHHAENSRLF